MALGIFPAAAAERVFDWGEYALDRTPPGFLSTAPAYATGGQWKIILDEVAPVMEPLTPNAARLTRRPVLAQLSRSQAAHQIPMFIFEGAEYGDCKVATRFKLAAGVVEQTAGIVFRFQNESNFYVARASASGRNFQCFKMANGQWKPPIGPKVDVTTNAWHALSVQCEGTRILCSLDGTNEIKLIDSSGTRGGKAGFWTESDCVAYFVDTKISFSETESLAQKLVKDALREYPRLLGLKIYAVKTNGAGPTVVASKDPAEIGKSGGKNESEVLTRGVRAYAKSKPSVSVTLPLHDRNGDPIAAVCVILKTFPGETEESALIRAQPILQKMQTQVQSLDDLLQ